MITQHSLLAISLQSVYCQYFANTSCQRQPTIRAAAAPPQPHRGTKNRISLPADILKHFFLQKQHPTTSTQNFTVAVGQTNKQTFIFFL